ncbi:replication initiation protein, partial [Corynebacterium striatum]
MSLPNTDTAVEVPQRVPTKKSHWNAAQLLTQTLGATPTTLGNFGVTDSDRQQLIAHLGRKTLQGSPTRNFKAAWRKDKDGNTAPKLYRVEAPALGRCQYVALTHKQRSTVIVVDVDRRGVAGGTIECLKDLTPFWWTPDIQLSRAGKKGKLPLCPGTPNSSDAMLWLSMRT